MNSTLRVAAGAKSRYMRESVYIGRTSYSCLGFLRRSLLGGHWDVGSFCGSRALYANNFSANANANNGSQGASDSVWSAKPSLAGCPALAFAKTHNMGTAEASTAVSESLRHFSNGMRKIKRHGNLYDKIIQKENLELALDKARKNNGRKSKRGKAEIAKVLQDREKYISKLHDMLASGNFHTSEYRTRRIYEPKERLLYILPFFPDRIVHHAIMNILEPIWDRLMYYHSYSCRKGKGQHVASVKCMAWVKRYKYILKCDCSKFYPSMRHDVAKRLIRRKIKDRRLITLLDDILDSVEGETNVPIGNFLSQWIGNIYLNELDTFAKQELKAKAYIRYCDDFIFFSDDKNELHKYKDRCVEFLSKIGLRLSKGDIFPSTRGLDFLGYRQFPNGKVLVRKTTAVRMKRRIRKSMAEYRKGRIDKEHMQSQLASAIGWIKHANSHHLKLAMKLDEYWKEVRGA